MVEQVTLTLDGQKYDGWTDVTIVRSLDSLVGSFTLGLSDRERTGDQPWPMRAGALCTVSIDGEILITGWIDRLSPLLDKESHDIVISGRDKASDMVDASAVHPSGSWKNATLQQITSELAQPFGVAIDFAAPADTKIKRFALQQGESAWSAIERLARMRGLIIWSLADGRIRVGNPGQGAVVGVLKQGQNILSASAVHDVSDRFGEYIVKGQASGDDEANGATVSKITARATDPAINRHRPLIIIAEDQASKASAQKRAEWEANVRAARSQPAQVTVQGWKNAGALWAIDSKIKLEAPALYIDAEMLIAGVTFIKSNDAGTVTELRLERPEAYAQGPAEGDDASALGGD
ncbi:phage baseplate assembly protein [Sphingorhabdus sp. 109]|uniref:phage baseplate assembly protein n=1 Tax=Sphingorhabdus sp. 109 TaxID=2653173 RepID=UPI0012F22636|nr:contractile injection system protein, VgrG/Pvc8 family [Sphingorhabdus sp. 109]VWX62606.1 conserved hypothetical protein [Sphingorhabdus sp. 109]